MILDKKYIKRHRTVDITKTKQIKAKPLTVYRFGNCLPHLYYMLYIRIADTPVEYIDSFELHSMLMGCIVTMVSHYSHNRW